MIYHTSDTYIVGTALNTFAGDYVDMIINDIWQPIGVSESSYNVRRTYDENVDQAFSGWGATLKADDIAKIAKHLNMDDGKIGTSMMYDKAQFDAAMQRDASDRGLWAQSSPFRYNNGFWGYDLSTTSWCNNGYTALMSGYGGITVLLLPNDTVYYYFSDNDDFVWLAAAEELNNYSNYCN